MVTGNLILTCFSLLILVGHFLQTSHAHKMNRHNCSASACGIIRNISFPFRLKDDPKHCGFSCYELACENNVASVYLNSQKYHVKAINYDNFTIRLADVSITNNSCSFPKLSLYWHNLSGNDPYSPQTRGFSVFDKGYPDVAWPINFMSCPYRLNNSSLLTETTDCANGENFQLGASNSSSGQHIYIKVGHMNASYVKHMCGLDLIVLTSWRFKDLKNVSLSEIHDSLLYGFELTWARFCSECGGRWWCAPTEGFSYACDAMPDLLIPFFKRIKGLSGAIILFLLLVLGVGIPEKIIIGFTSLVVLLGFVRIEVFVSIDISPFLLFGLLFIIVACHLAKIIIGFPCVIGLLIYKFRRRHLSVFDAIEGFLRSNNKLMPIRYSYSDIKTMTRGFREKLGQGGYGSVYKGKLRSGNDVAVKLLGKPGANGQDFMNEIATIGRIHHVNVVELVGYCAERSKRALVFDFMPNGSLEKFIFGRKKTNSLNWKRKFEIAVGVARGIEYLHRGCDIQILHFDIKPHNILLDDKFIPKISDFGLAKFCSTEKDTVTMTAARGTIGYVAPELMNPGIGGVSYKADVYSFGMLLMEMVGLKRDFIGDNETSSKYFPYWIYECFNEGRDIEIGEVDENDDEDDNDGTRKIAKKITIVALWCIQMCPDDRPSMNKVVQMLEGEVEHLQIPPRSSQSPQLAVGNEDRTWSTSSSPSVSLLCHDAAPCIEMTAQDVQGLQQ